MYRLISLHETITKLLLDIEGVLALQSDQVVL
jgi:hypothetical protein